LFDALVIAMLKVYIIVLIRRLVDNKDLMRSSLGREMHNLFGRKNN